MLDSCSQTIVLFKTISRPSHAKDILEQDIILYKRFPYAHCAQWSEIENYIRKPQPFFTAPYFRRNYSILNLEIVEK